MFSESLIDRDTILAFLETEYRVFGDSPFTLKIGEPSSSLAAACKRHRTESSAYVTACNPNSKTLDDSANAEKHTSLRQELTKRNLAFIEGVGQHPSNAWPGEPSFLIFGLDKGDARELSIELQQDAFVWAGPDGLPQLILLR